VSFEDRLTIKWHELLQPAVRGLAQFVILEREDAMNSRMSTRRSSRGKSPSRRRPIQAACGKAIEQLERRQLLSVSWTGLSASGSGPGSGGGMMMLLSDGRVLVQNGSNPPPSASVFTLSPQTNTGSYVNGVWAGTGNLNESRLFFTTATLPDGKIFAIGGEYPKFSNTTEIYDPQTGLWTPQDPIPTPSTNVDLSGKVTGASNSSPITISTSSTNQLQNGMQVTISGVGGNTAANGTFTVANVGGSSFDLVGSTGNGSYTSGGSWSAFVPQYGDDPIVVLQPDASHPNGQILAGYFNNTNTYRFDPAAPSGSQWTQTAGGKLHGDRSDEETWVKLKDGSILSYDVFSSMGGPFQAQRYIPAQDKWVDASTLDGANPPSVLSDPATPDGSGNFNGQGAEMGPGFLMTNGNVVFFGANGNTAIYNPTTDKWSAGPLEPVSGGNTWVGTDDPGAVLPNGNILIALSPLGNQPADSKGNPGGYSFPGGTNIYEFNTSGFTDVSPGSGGRGGSSIGDNAFELNMLLLPNGQVLLSNEKDSFQVFTDTGAPQDAWRPTITNIVSNGGGVFTLNGTQLNGLDEGSTYGDDNESVTNYPLIRFTDSGGNVSYARTFNWSSVGVATDGAPVSTKFNLPSGHSSLSDFQSLVVIANGIPSFPINSAATPNLTAPADQTAVEGASKSFNLGSFIDPDGSPWAVKVDWGDSNTTNFSTASDGTIPAKNHTFAEEGTYTVTVTVTDSTSLSASVTFKVTVSDPAVIPSSTTINPVEGQNTGSVVVASFTDPGGPEVTSDYSATIDWGDGTPSTNGVISVSGVTFSVSGSHTYAEESAADHPGSFPSYTIHVVIHHEAAPTASIDSHAVVSDPAVAALGGFTFDAVEGVPSAIQTVATFTDPGGAEALSDYNATIDWGDGTAPTLNATITFAAGVFTVTGSHTYATGLGLPDDFGNTFCDADVPSYHKQITVTIKHENALPSTATSDAHIKLPPASAHLAGGSLIVVATTGDDHVQITPVGNTGAVSVSLNSVSLNPPGGGGWTLGPGGRIIVAAMDGNDDIQVAGGVRLNTVLYGAPGDDRIKGGGGQNIEVGCEGNDDLTGGSIHDLLIGGEGADKLNGTAGGDIVIAAVVVDASNVETDKYSTLVAILNTGIAKVADDDAVDVLQGASGSDLFYYNFIGAGVKDIVHGKVDSAIDI